MELSPAKAIGLAGRSIKWIGKGAAKIPAVKKAIQTAERTFNTICKSRKAANAIQKATRQSHVCDRIASIQQKYFGITPKNEIGYIPKSRTGEFLKLPRNKYGQHIPSTNTPHTQIGYRKGRNGGYRQTREWGYDGFEVKTTDWTDHGRNHPFPHDHFSNPNPCEGTPSRGSPEPFRWP